MVQQESRLLVAGNSIQAKSIMLMIQNNLDPSIAQHPQELITYGGNGSRKKNFL